MNLYNAICPERRAGCLDRYVSKEGDKLGGYIDVKRCASCVELGRSENPALRAANKEGGDNSRGIRYNLTGKRLKGRKRA